MITKSLNGCQKTTNEIISLTEKQISIILNKSGIPYSDREDVSQDILLKVYTNLAKFKPDFQFQSWVSKIAKNHIIDLSRSSKNKTFVAIEESLNEISDDSEDNFSKGVVLKDQEDIADIVLEKQEKKEVLNTIKDSFILSDKQKLVFELRFQENKKYKEIVEITGFPMNTVKTLIKRVSQTIKQNNFVA
jgi:RNA polymerase sigma-70 factor (ECF subfamily)